MKIIGVTGGVGAGKSTVLLHLKEAHNAFILEADKAGHLLMEPGQSCYEPVIRLFGNFIINPDGTLDRKKISDIVFQDARKLDALNRIIHPGVRTYILDALARESKNGRALCVVEAALLLEADYQEFCDEVWYVYASEEVRIRRLAESRGYSEEKSKSVIRRQMTDLQFRAGADFVIDNSGSEKDTIDQIERRLAITAALKDTKDQIERRPAITAALKDTKNQIERRLTNT